MNKSENELIKEKIKKRIKKIKQSPVETTDMQEPTLKSGIHNELELQRSEKDDEEK